MVSGTVVIISIILWLCPEPGEKSQVVPNLPCNSWLGPEDREWVKKKKVHLRTILGTETSALETEQISLVHTGKKESSGTASGLTQGHSHRLE